MFDAKKRKEERFASGAEDQISLKAYNLIVGATILYGFVVNVVTVLLARNVLISLLDRFLWFPFAFLAGYFVMAICGSILAMRSNRPIWSFVGYNLIVFPIGAVLALLLPFYASRYILLAVVLTGIVTVIMLVLSMTFPKLFSRLGPSLLLALGVGILAEVGAGLLGFDGTLLDILFVVLFSLYIGYDWHRAKAYPKTVDNAIDSAVDLYLDIINIFTRLLDIIDKIKN
ncbi:MAG: US12 family protein [Clostridia bacterium]|nr:US12 family protein [Clostridia bacterium]